MKRQITARNKKASTRPRKGDRGLDFMTPREIAHVSGIGVLTIYGFLREGILQSVRVGKAYYVPRAEYHRFQAQFVKAGFAA